MTTQKQMWCVQIQLNAFFLWAHHPPTPKPTQNHDKKAALQHMINKFHATADILAQQLSYDDPKWINSIMSSKLKSASTTVQGYVKAIHTHEKTNCSTWPKTSEAQRDTAYVMFHKV